MERQQVAQTLSEKLRQTEWTHDTLAQAYDKIQKKIPREYRVQDIPEHVIREVLVEEMITLSQDLPYTHDILQDIQHYKQNYQYYPDPKEPQFIEEISHKYEMGINYVHHSRKTPEEACNRDFFELAPHQIFLKQWMSPYTPYRSLLIFHGVGVGKTCSGITIAENFKDIAQEKKKRIIVLASTNIQIGWQKTIYNPEKGDNQCTGDTYELPEMVSDKPLKDPEKQSKRIVRKYYELHGYAAFANSVKRLIKKNTAGYSEDSPEYSKLMIQCIQETYSDRVLIVDEVHNIRTGGESEVRDTLHHIELVLKYSKDLKLILLTANPMFNQAEEIVWILNMLRLNDSKSMLIHSDIFHEGKVTEEGIQILHEGCKGYVSYLRGENPVSFPLRLYPQHISPLITKDHCPSLNIFGNELLPRDKLQFLTLVPSLLQDFQKEAYDEITSQYRGQILLQNQDEHRLLQMSNIVYPMNDIPDDPKPLYGEAGFERCFHKHKRGSHIGYSYKQEIVREHGEFLHRDILPQYSSKIADIINEIDQSEGIVFVYSAWIKGGILPLMLALEQHGYRKYKSPEILECEHKDEPISYNGFPQSKDQDFKQACYIVISGSGEGLTNNLADELQALTCKENSDGSQIKIVLGSKVASEGLDFKCVRSIHVMEPWHNLNRLEQVIGRGVRNCSHLNLSPEKRNTTIYLHTGYNGENETIETYLYRKSERKARDIGDIEMILKKQAIDQYLFQNMNHLTKYDVDTIKVQPAFRKSTIYETIPCDKPYSRVCSFQPDCGYIPRGFPMNHFKDWNKDTFHIEYSSGLTSVYKKRIQYLVSQELVFKIQHIKKRIIEYQQVYDELLKEALYQIVSEKEMIYSCKGDAGYITLVDEFLMFQPVYSNDPLYPYYYRIHKGCLQTDPPRLTLPEKRRVVVSDSEINYAWEQLEIFFKRIQNYTFTTHEKIVKDISHAGAQETNRYILNRLSFSEKLIACYVTLQVFTNDKLLVNHKQYKQYKEIVDSIVDYFKDHIVYQSQDTYTLEHGNQIFGCIVYHCKNKKLYCYQYCIEKRALILCNLIDQMEIQDSLQYKPTFSVKQNTWGFMIYMESFRHKQNGMLCKLVSHSDRIKKTYKYPPGPGVVIIRDTNKTDQRLQSTDPYMYIQKQFPQWLDRLSAENKQSFQKSKSKNQYTVAIEYALICEKRVVSPELMSLLYKA
mgnify:CR=1 FL=1|uniref:Helicase ATP-binding domain-containing protein n=1 Tax=viral metagenome TaxID=1070528 RepID=A0A6C0F8G2_9ZZZZ|tara:strand:- start:10708 stop:14295 length:3588 start_codon:yes stop_codon:yes gene_type:complete